MKQINDEFTIDCNKINIDDEFKIIDTMCNHNQYYILIDDNNSYNQYRIVITTEYDVIIQYVYTEYDDVIDLINVNCNSLCTCDDEIYNNINKFINMSLTYYMNVRKFF